MVHSRPDTTTAGTPRHLPLGLGALTLTLAVVLGAATAPGAEAQRAMQESPELRRMLQELTPTTRGIKPITEAPVVAPATPAQPANATRPAMRPVMAAVPNPAPSTSLVVRFPTASAELTAETERGLATLGQALSSPELAEYRFRIEGHTDTAGDSASNQALSERRAAAVREFLVRRFSVNPARLETVGLGESDLAVPTGDEVPEARNRRVRVVNIGG